MGHELPEPDVVAAIFAFNRDRIAKRVRLKYHRMSKDVFAFFRGTDHLFAYHWDRLRPPDVGPAILICGDLHLENFGAYRSEDGDFLYDINDFDEAIVAPCSLDLVRCATSILLAAQVWKFTPVQAMRTVLDYIDHYRATIAEAMATGRIGIVALESARGPIWELLRRPFRGDHVAFLDQLTKTLQDGGRRLRRTKGRYLSLRKRRRKQVQTAFENHFADRHPSDRVEVMDVAARLAGIGSLGLHRYAVVVRAGSAPENDQIWDIKEARPPALLACSGEAPTHDHASGLDALRVVQAQRQLQAKPPVGLDTIRINDKEYRLRALIPEENRTSLEELHDHPARLRHAVAVAGQLTAWAHLRGSRLGYEDRAAELARWAAGPGLDAVIASAVRFGEQTRRDYISFRRAAAAKNFRRAFVSRETASN